MIKTKINGNLLLANDFHVGRDNIDEFQKNWVEAVDVARENNADMIVGGDIFLSRAAQTLDVLTAVKGVYQYAMINDVKVYAFPGNHDLVDQEAAESYIDFFPFEVPTDCGVLDMGDVWLYYMRYWPERMFEDALKELLRLFPLEDDGIRRMLYCHEGIRGGLSTANDDELPTSVFEGFDKVFVGHYHNRNKIPGTNIEYIGSSRQHNFGEDVMKGYTLLFRDGSTKFIPNEINIQYLTFQTDFNSDNSEILQSIESAKERLRGQARIRVIVNGTAEESKVFDRDLFFSAGVNKIVFETEATDVEKQGEQSLLTERFDKDSLKEEYKSFCNKKGEDPAPGIQYLTQIQSYHVEDTQN